MKVLVACEESQVVCKAFRYRGHEAYSCDLQPCSGGFPEWHIQDDVLKYLDIKWDLIIAHPPCTYFSNATQVNLGRRDHPDIFNDEWRERFYSLRDFYFNFAMTLFNAPCDRVAMENVVGYLCTHFRRPDQYIEPYLFGDPWKKRTCLWLRNLPPLMPTNIIAPLGKWVNLPNKKRNNMQGCLLKGVYGSKNRSKTFPGIAAAMADQWTF